MTEASPAAPEEATVYACLCAAVPESEVHECIQAGARTVDELGDECAAGTGCGSCHERLAAMLAATQVAELPHTA